jgi:EPS-associated MarR family transcriptional regulator
MTDRTRANAVSDSDPGDLHYELLRHLTDQPMTSQRGLAERMGVSVGRINYCMRALVDRGWVKANNFRRSDNKWAYAYLLTPKGVSAKLRLTRAFLARKEAEFDALQREIATLRKQIDGGDERALPPSTNARTRSEQP